MIKKELQKILQHKMLLLTVLVICLIPILYAGVFLKSIWDPYGHMDRLPVAVVNLDEAAVYQGKTFHVGDDLADNLKKSESLNWDFVSEEKAQQGLKDKKYYMVLTLPKNLSKNAATVMNPDPEKMDITYETNGSLNFISEVVSDSAMKTLKNEVSANVTKAYASAIISAMQKAGDGMQAASDGATKLDDGAVQLKNGTTQLSEKVPTLANGVNDLTNGSKSLANGISQYTGGVATLAAGANTVNQGTSQLASLVPALASGTAQLASGSSALTNGIAQYTGGVTALNDGAAALNTGVSSLAGQVPALTGGIHQLADGATELDNGVQTLVAATNQTADTLGAALPKVKQLNDGSAALSSGLDQLSAKEQELAAGLNALDSALASTSDLATLTQALSNPNFDSLPSDKKQAILSQAAQLSGALAQSRDSVSQLSSGASQISAKLSEAASSTKEMSNGISAMNSQLTAISEKATSQTAKDQLNQLSQGATAVSKGLSTLDTQTGALTDGVTQLASGSQALADGTSTLNNQSQNLTTGAQTLESGLNQMNSQTPKLTSGANKLAQGTQNLAEGAQTLNSKSSTLNQGSQTLSSGLQTLNGNIPTLTSGVKKLQSGTATLESGTKELAAKLTAGAAQVNDAHLTDKTAEMISAPAKVEKKKYSSVPNYGTALSPYFMSVSIFVGCVMFNLVYPIRKIADKSGSAFGWFLSKAAVGGFAATMMALVLGTVMMMLGLHVEHVGSYYSVLLAHAWASMFLVMFLAMAFDNVGRFISMVLLVVQLGASGGTFPLETSSHIYRAIHPFIPMTYSITGLRQSITSGLGSSTVAQSLTILITVAVVCIILLAVTMTILKKRHMAGYSQMNNIQDTLSDDYKYGSGDSEKTYTLW